MIADILQEPSKKIIFKEIKTIGQNIIKNQENSIIPDYAWEIVGVNPDSPLSNFDCVGEKEYYYFKKCLDASRLRKEGKLDEAAKLLMEAKWDFDGWALAHYLLGLIFLEKEKYKDAYTQFKQAAKLEPFNHLPMAIMREVSNYIILHR